MLFHLLFSEQASAYPSSGKHWTVDNLSLLIRSSGQPALLLGAIIIIILCAPIVRMQLRLLSVHLIMVTSTGGGGGGTLVLLSISLLKQVLYSLSELHTAARICRNL